MRRFLICRSGYAPASLGFPLMDVEAQRTERTNKVPGIA